MGRKREKATGKLEFPVDTEFPWRSREGHSQLWQKHLISLFCRKLFVPSILLLCSDISRGLCEFCLLGACLTFPFLLVSPLKIKCSLVKIHFPPQPHWLNENKFASCYEITSISVLYFDFELVFFLRFFYSFFVAFVLGYSLGGLEVWVGKLWDCVSNTLEK